MQIAKDNIESVFHEKIKELPAVTVNDSLEVLINFYNNYPINDVDTDFPENDMLLFEYGIYDLQDGKGENFTFVFTRQFYTGQIAKGDLFNLQLLLYYDKEDFAGIEPYNKWSDEFEDIDDWARKIKKSEGFVQTMNKAPKSFDIFLANPDT